MTIGVIVTVAAHASPLDIVAHYVAEGEVTVAGRLVSAEVRVRDEGRAPVPDLPVRLTFSLDDQPDAEPVSRVSMTDTNGIIELSTILPDGAWSWAVESVPDRFVELEVLQGSIRTGAAAVMIEMEPEIIRRAEEVLAVDATASTEGVRIRRQSARAALQCPGRAPDTVTVQTDMLGRARFAFDVALPDAGACSLQVSLSVPEAGLSGEAFSTIRVAGDTTVSGRIQPASSVLGLVRTWRVEAEASDENGPFAGGTYALVSESREIARWSGSGPPPSELPADLLRADEQLDLLFFSESSDTEPLARAVVFADAAGVDPSRMLGYGALGLLLVILVAVAGRALLRLLTGRNRDAGGTARPVSIRPSAPADGVWFFDDGTARRLRVRVRCGDTHTWATGGRWKPDDRSTGPWTIVAELEGYVPVTMTLSSADVDAGFRIDMKTWRRSVIELLVEVLRELGVSQASEAWWGKRSPTHLRRPALERARGLAPDTVRCELDWPSSRANIARSDLRPHEALEMLFNLADRVAFAETDIDSVGRQAWDDARRLADRIRPSAQEAS